MLSHFFLRRFIIFYTNVDRYGNQILFRGYNNKTQITKKVKFEPTFYIPSPKGTWKTLDGRTVDSVQPGSMRDCKEFMDMVTITRHRLLRRSSLNRHFIFPRQRVHGRLSTDVL